ncbi:snoRNA-binding protein [Arachnomyces sp. PD_36]|nr:snoRNA-binding protein [Arachnomyces sp. PD_36]
MAKDRSEKEEKRREKKEKKEKKRAESDGVHKSKKVKKDKTALAEAAEKELTTQALGQIEDAVAVNGDVEMEVTVEEKENAVPRPVGAVVPFANPLAEDKVAKKVLKSVKKAAVNKTLKRGVKEVVKALRKSPTPSANASITIPTGIVVLAADISPMDVISHIPVLCEDHGIPYVYVTSRAELGSAGATKRPTSVVMVVPRTGKNKKDGKEGDDKEFEKVYEELTKVVQKEGKKVKV